MPTLLQRRVQLRQSSRIESVPVEPVETSAPSVTLLERRVALRSAPSPQYGSEGTLLERRARLRKTLPPGGTLLQRRAALRLASPAPQPPTTAKPATIPKEVQSGAGQEGRVAESLPNLAPMSPAMVDYLNRPEAKEAAKNIAPLVAEGKAQSAVPEGKADKIDWTMFFKSAAVGTPQVVKAVGTGLEAGPDLERVYPTHEIGGVTLDEEVPKEKVRLPGFWGGQPQHKETGEDLYSDIEYGPDAKTITKERYFRFTRKPITVGDIATAAVLELGQGKERAERGAFSVAGSVTKEAGKVLQRAIPESWSKETQEAAAGPLFEFSPAAANAWTANIGSQAPVLATTLIGGPPGGFALMSLMEAGTFHEAATTIGIDEDISKRYSQIYGPISGSIEYAQFWWMGKAFGARASKPLTGAARKFAIKVLKEVGGIAWEGGEELSQNTVENLLLQKAIEEQNARYPDRPPLTPPALGDGGLHAFVLGAAVAGVYRGAGHIESYAQARLGQIGKVAAAETRPGTGAEAKTPPAEVRTQATDAAVPLSAADPAEVARVAKEAEAIGAKYDGITEGGSSQVTLPGGSTVSIKPGESVAAINAAWEASAAQAKAKIPEGETAFEAGMKAGAPSAPATLESATAAAKAAPEAPGLRRTNAEATVGPTAPVPQAVIDEAVAAVNALPKPSKRASLIVVARVAKKHGLDVKVLRQAVTDTAEVRAPEERAPAVVAKPPVAMEPRLPGESISTTEIKRVLEQQFQVPIRTGRLVGPFAAVYKTQPEVIRSKTFGEVGEYLHESAHHLVKKDVSVLTQMPPECRKEIRRLDYEPEKHRLREGFAEFFRKYMTDDGADTDAPAAYQWFVNEWLPKSPWSDPIRISKEAVNQWQAPGAVERVKAQIAQAPSRLTKLVDWLGHPLRIWDRLVGQWQNRLHITVRIAREITGLRDPLRQLPPEVNFPLYAKVIQMSASAKTQHAILDYMPDATGSNVGPSLREYMMPIAKELRDPKTLWDFYAFAYARHAIDVHAQNKNPGISLTDAKYVVEKFQERPGWTQAADGLKKWHDGLLDYLIDAGGLSPEAKKVMNEMYPNYISLARDMETGYIGTGAGGIRLGDLPQPVRRLRGSGRRILPPLETAILYAERTFALADKIRFGRMLIDFSKQYPGAGKYVERVSPVIKPTSFDIDEIRAQLTARGVPVENAEGLLTIFRATHIGDPKNSILTLYDKNGRPESYFIDPELYGMMMGIDRPFRLPPILHWTLGAAVRSVRLGTTGLKAAFSLITNPLRDIQTVFMQTESKGLRSNPLSVAIRSVGGIVNDMTGGEASRLWKAGGGEMAQPLGIDRRFLKEAVHEILATDPKSKILNWSRHPVDSLRSIFSVPEAGPRVGEFKASLKRMGWKPGQRLTFQQYMMAQMDAANVSVDFREGGSLGMWLNQLTAFFNPAIQGPARMADTIKRHPFRSFFRGIAYITLPTLALWWKYKDEEWYINLPPEERYRYWHIKINGTILRIPRPFEWAHVFGSLPEGIADWIYRRNPQAFKDAGVRTLEDALPSLIPTGIEPSMEVAANWDWFRDRPLVNKGQEGLLPEDRTNPWDTETARAIGKLFHVPPAYVQHLLEGYTGGLATDIIGNLETSARWMGAMPMQGTRPREWADLPVVGRLFLRPNTTRLIDDFYEERDRLSQRYRSAKTKGDFSTIDTTDINRSLTFDAYSKTMTLYRTQIKTIIENPSLSDDEKRRAILEKQEQMISLAKQALAMKKGMASR